MKTQKLNRVVVVGEYLTMETLVDLTLEKEIPQCESEGRVVERGTPAEYDSPE
jgi:hypothetical protein